MLQKCWQWTLILVVAWMPMMAGAETPTADALLAEADKYRFAEVSQQDLKRASSLYQKACRAGSVTACAEREILNYEAQLRSEYIEVAEKNLDPIRSWGRWGKVRWRVQEEKMFGRDVVKRPIEKAEIELLSTRCNEGQGRACRVGSQLYQRGIGAVSIRPFRARKLAKRACEFGSGQGCFLWATVQPLPWPLGLAKPVVTPLGAKRFKQSCDLGDGYGCLAYGKLLAIGMGVAKDESRAFQIFTQQAERGWMHAPYFVGWSHFRGKGVEKDKLKGIEEWNTGCKAGDSKSCTARSRVLDGWNNVYLKSKRACMSGDPVECDRLHGLGVPKFLEKACEGGMGRSCFKLGLAGGSSQPPLERAEWFKKACDGGVARACNWLGEHYYTGKVVTKDHALSAEYYRKACDKNHAEGCYNFGVFYFNGEVFEEDTAKAKEIFRKSCDLGLKKACEWADKP